MASVNKVILIGNLGRDPEMRYASSGSAICNLVIATSRNWKNKESGGKQEEVEWSRVVLFDRLAEVAAEYLKKGRPVFIEGRLKTRKWQDKEGRDVYTTEIVAEQMQLLGGREDGPAPAPRPASAPARSATARPDGRPKDEAYRAAAAPRASSGFDDMDDDIPF